MSRKVTKKEADFAMSFVQRIINSKDHGRYRAAGGAINIVLDYLKQNSPLEPSRPTLNQRLSTKN